MLGRLIGTCLLTAATPWFLLGVRPSDAAPGSPPPRYSVMDLGDMPRDFDLYRLRVRTPKHWPKMGVLAGYQITVPKDINQQGQVVGSNVLPAGGAYLVEKDHAFVWDNGALHDLGALPGDKVSHAVAINNNGAIVGDSCKANFPPGRYLSHAVLWSRGQIRDLAKGFAVGINDADQVIGYSPGVGNGNALYTHAWIWRAGKRPIDLGNLGGFTVEPRSINYAGQVVGDSGTSGQSLDDITQWNGVYHSAKSVHTHAFLWQSGRLYDLNTLIPTTPGLVLLSAYSINEQGAIHCIGEINGRRRRIALLPTK